MSANPIWVRACGLLVALLLVLPPASLPAATVTKAAKPSGKKPAAKRTRWPPVEMFALNRKETLHLRLADDHGRPIKGVARRVDHFLRCHHTNKQTKMNPRLVRVVYETARHFPGKRVEVISGYRHPSVAKNPNSPHMHGLACDFRISGIKNSDLRDYLRRTYERIGVGYYPNSSFVHLDVRKDRSAFWIDYSGPGERAAYAEKPFDDLKNGRADTFKPSQIDPAFVDEVAEAGHDDAPVEQTTTGVAAGQAPALR